MIKYRPQRGSLDSSMEEMELFDDIAEMLRYIANEHSNMFEPEDIIITESQGADDRINWNSWRYVCVRCYGGIRYPIPPCIGMCDFGECD